MGIPERRYVQYEDDGASMYQCLACQCQFLSVSSAEYMSFCPYCGVKWEGDMWAHRPHSIHRWKWDMYERDRHLLRSTPPAKYTPAQRRMDDAADEKARQVEEQLDRAYKNYRHIADWERACQRRRETYEQGARARKYNWDDYCPTPGRDAAGWAWHPYPEVVPRWTDINAIRFADGRERIGVYSPHADPHWTEYGSGWKFSQQPTHWYGRLDV